MRIFAFILLVLLFGCNNSSDRVIVGTSADNPPYEYVKDGQIVGIDIDIIKEIAKILNKELEIKNMDFSMLIPSLSTGNIDIVIAGISSTEQRKKNVDFSDIYLSSKIAILFRGESNIISSRDLQGKIIGAQFGSVWSNVAHTLSSNVRELSNNLFLLEELNVGNIDALVIEESQAKIFSKKYPKLKYFVLKESSDFAIALRKNSPMTQSINEAIVQMRNDKAMEKIQSDWYDKN